MGEGRIDVVERVPRLVVGLVLFAVGVVLGLYGLLLILYHGEGGGSGTHFTTNTYVDLAGRRVDARVAGAVSLVAAAVLIAVALLVLRLRRRR